jgi:exopolysaccharide production protein ExoY
MRPCVECPDFSLTCQATLAGFNAVLCGIKLLEPTRRTPAPLEGPSPRRRVPDAKPTSFAVHYSQQEPSCSLPTKPQCPIAPPSAGAGADWPRAPRWKRVLDFTCILLVSPGLILLGILITLYIKVISPGAVLFKQERIGFRGRRFLCMKFRTMVPNADTSLHQDHFAELMASGRPMVKLDMAGDKRLIPGGVFLRSLGLDELPQILNVLRGEMSLVGPRPCLAYECEKYESRHCRRFDTLPGLTGLWQVSGKNRTTFEEMIALDLRYAERKSILLDLKIIAWTVPAIVLQSRETKRETKGGGATGFGAGRPAPGR